MVEFTCDPKFSMRSSDLLPQRQNKSRRFHEAPIREEKKSNSLPKFPSLWKGGWRVEIMHKVKFKLSSPFSRLHTSHVFRIVPNTTPPADKISTESCFVIQRKQDNFLSKTTVVSEIQRSRRQHWERKWVSFRLSWNKMWAMT